MYLSAPIGILRRCLTYLQSLQQRSSVRAFDRNGRTYRLGQLTYEIPGEPLTDVAFRSRFVDGGRYETEDEYLLVERHLIRDGSLLELGGCIGVMACFANSLLADPRRHVVIEANPHLIPWLETNKQRNNAQFTIHNAVLGHPGRVTFYLHRLIVGSSTKRQTSHPIDVTSLNAADFAGFDNLFIDIEGGELPLLTHHKQIFSTTRILFIELHPFAGILTAAESAACENMLHDLGFRKIDADRRHCFQVWENVRLEATAAAAPPDTSVS